MNIRLVLVTCPEGEKAREIAGQLVEHKLAACVNIIPGLTSIYHWQGKIESDAECLLVMKSTDEQLTELEQELHRLHPYDTPEFVVLTPEHVSQKYQQWVCDSATNER